MRELIVNGNNVNYEVEHISGGEITVKLNGKTFHFKSWSKSGLDELKRVEVDGRNINLWKSGEWTSFADTLVQVRSTRSTNRSKGGSSDSGGMLSPMPGKILKTMVTVGQSVKAGDGLLVMEAMKMEHTIKANVDGVIEAIHCEEGGLVDGGVELVSLIESAAKEE